MLQGLQLTKPQVEKDQLQRCYQEPQHTKSSVAKSACAKAMVL